MTGSPWAARAAAALLVACGGREPEGNGDSTDAAGVERGRHLYRAHGCALCHGTQGRGDGHLAHTLAPKPRDFRDAAGFRHGHDVEAIAATVRDGVVAERTAMPAYRHLSAADLRSLALFVRSLSRDGAEEAGAKEAEAKEAEAKEAL